MNNILLRFLLLKGPLWHRMYLVTFYVLLLDYLVTFWIFFSQPPGPASIMNDRMNRVLSEPAMIMIPITVAAIIIWLSAGVACAVKAKRKRLMEPWGIAYAVLPIVGYFVLATIYNAFASGRGTQIHEWLYNL